MSVSMGKCLLENVAYDFVFISLTVFSESYTFFLDGLYDRCWMAIQLFGIMLIAQILQKSGLNHCVVIL